MFWTAKPDNFGNGPESKILGSGPKSSQNGPNNALFDHFLTIFGCLILIPLILAQSSDTTVRKGIKMGREMIEKGSNLCSFYNIYCEKSGKFGGPKNWSKNGQKVVKNTKILGVRGYGGDSKRFSTPFLNHFLALFGTFLTTFLHFFSENCHFFDPTVLQKVGSYLPNGKMRYQKVAKFGAQKMAKKCQKVQFFVQKRGPKNVCYLHHSPERPEFSVFWPLFDHFLINFWVFHFFHFFWKKL